MLIESPLCPLVCEQQRTLAYWQLLQAKRFWCILVDAKRKECSDATGRIAPQFRQPFHKQEFGRYKRLLNAVDTFEMQTRRSDVYMTNVWKKVTPHHVRSDFLPSVKRRHSTESRRGMMDSFVAESDEEDEESGGEEAAQEDEAAEGGSNGARESAEDEEKDGAVHRGSSGKRAAPDHHVKTEEGVDANATVQSSGSGGGNSTEVEDLLCLVCGENPRNGGIVHGQYMHFYCCFRCGKRQFRSKMGCLVCDRPIDRVLRLLPLTPEARDAIKKNQK